MHAQLLPLVCSTVPTTVGSLCHVCPASPQGKGLQPWVQLAQLREEAATKCALAIDEVEYLTSNTLVIKGHVREPGQTQ
jgi:hypothetical protein